MDETKHHSELSGAGHETSDVNIWAVGKFLAALVAITMVSLLCCSGYSSSSNRGKTRAWRTPWNRASSFPQPQLQQTPVVDLKTIRAEEDQYLNSYAWVDQKKGVVRIPIDRAIEVLAQRGLPSRPQQGQSK